MVAEYKKTKHDGAVKAEGQKAMQKSKTADQVREHEAKTVTDAFIRGDKEYRNVAKRGKGG